MYINFHQMTQSLNQCNRLALVLYVLFARFLFFKPLSLTLAKSRMYGKLSKNVGWNSTNFEKKI